VANAIVDGQLNLSALEVKDDQTVRSKLLKVKGVGPWSANIYLLTVLRRPDVWPSEDLALAVAAQRLKRLTTRPTPRELEHLSEVWKPWRAVAARLLWHYYIETVSKNRHREIRSGEAPTV
jgi:DNA-3-methyladenine glycosylase II